MGVSILLGTYKVPPPNPCWLRTEMGRGLCVINTRPQLTRIRGRQRRENDPKCSKFVKKVMSHQKSNAFAREMLFLTKKKPLRECAHGKKNKMSKIAQNRSKSNQKKIIPLPICMKISWEIWKKYSRRSKHKFFNVFGWFRALIKIWFFYYQTK